MLLMEKEETRKQEKRIPNRAIYSLFSVKFENLTELQCSEEILLKDHSSMLVPS